MNPSPQPDQSLESRLASPLLEVLIRAGLILALALLCYQIFSPFLPLMVWAVILAVTLYPLHQSLASQLGGRQGLAATLLVTVGLVLIVAPTVILMNSIGDSVHQLIHDVQNHSLKIPARGPVSRNGRSSASRSTICGRMPLRICRHWYKAYNRSWVNW